jgi:hypothetical protein
MNITPEQLSTIRSALWLAGYFVSDTSGGSQTEQWETDKDTVQKAWDTVYQIELEVTA